MIDVLIVSLGSTTGGRTSDDEFAASLQRAGARTALVRASPQPDVRTYALTDLVWARAARRAARHGIQEYEPRVVVYSTTTAALLWPLKGAIRFDALCPVTRPGRHGIWQRSREHRRLEQASLLIPVDESSLQGAGVTGTPSVVVPIPVESSAGAGSYAPSRDIAAVTYQSDPEMKGLDFLLEAWEQVRREGEELVVAGLERENRDGVRFVGRLERAEYRALLRRSKLFVIAPKREGYGIAQLEALADGCRLVTTRADGPYVALSILERIDPAAIASREDFPAAIRVALDSVDEDGQWAAQAARELTAFRRDRIDQVVATELLPRLLR
ncbi:MAG TPA: glycosyltransferase [Baekduia sp.]|nr:glycosyltransferase [Baekduia sp.]